MNLIDLSCKKNIKKLTKILNNGVFHIWKSNCRRRGKENTVSLEEFKKFCH